MTIRLTRLVTEDALRRAFHRAASNPHIDKPVGSDALASGGFWPDEPLVRVATRGAAVAKAAAKLSPWSVAGQELVTTLAAVVFVEREILDVV